MSNNNFRTIDLSYTAPELPYPMVSRPHLIQTLVQIYDSNTEIICVEGQSGYGKTTLLREFSESVDAPCFGVFLKAASRFSYDIVFARFDMTAQAYWYATSKKLTDDSEPTDGELRTLWGKCARKLIRKRKPGYIIVDGIHHIPSEEESIKQAILNLLPFGVKPFRFLFSGGIENSKFFNNKRLSIKSFPISSFTSHETDEFLKDLVKDRAIRSEFHTTLGGVPSLLASVRRQFVTSVNSGNELNLKSATNLELLFEAEWQLVGPFPDHIEKALGFILASGHPVDSQTISNYISINETEIGNAFSSLPFLNYSTKSNGWEFSSELFREFAEKKLNKSVRSATKDIASILLETPDSDDSLSRLPLYLERTGNTEKLVEWLNESRLASILLKTQSAAGLEPTLRKAISICHNSKNDRALVTYSTINSIVQQISQTTGMEHEIRARSALGDFEGASAVANDAPLLTQRLQLLAVLVASLSDRPGFQVQPLIDEINELLKQISISELPKEEAFDIAINLYPVDAKLALSLLKEIVQSDIEDSSFEIAIARITLAALHLKTIGEPHESENAHNPTPKNLIVDQKLRHLLETSTIFYHAKSASEVLDATKSMNDPSERLFFQRKWISQHPFQEDALDVVESAINDAITVSQFTPNATFYREISTPLANSIHKERRRNLVAILDGQQSIIYRKGPTVDYVRLQLHLAECSYVEDELSRTASRLEDLYLDSVEGIDELETRITCLAWFSAELHKFDSSGKLSEHTQVRELVDEELEKTLQDILENSADHFQILSRALDALALNRPDSAFAMSRRLNTIERRNEAFLHVIEAMCRANTKNPDSILLFEILDEMELCSNLNSAIEEITERLCQDIGDGIKPATVLEDLLYRLDKCSSSSTRMKCLGKMAVTIEQHSESSELRTSIVQNLLVEFSSIASPRVKYRVACQLISTLRAACPDLAKKIFKYLTNPDRGTSISENIEKGFFYIIDLITKAAWALAQSCLLTHNDVQRICSLINRVRDPFVKVNLYSKLAFFLWRENRTNFFSEIVNQHIWPTLTNLTGNDRTLLYNAWRNAYPSIWLEDRDRARNSIGELPSEVRDDCTSALSYALLRKQPPGEPFDDESYSTKTLLSYPDIRNLLQLCEETDEDFMIFIVFEWISSAVSVKNSKIRLTRDQKAEITRRMLEIAETNLPAENRIQHTGFQILCRAQALRIGQSETSKWEDLIKESEALANAADRVYVLAYLASNLPAKQKKKSERLFEIAESEADGLKTMEDQYERYCIIANLAAEKNKEHALRVLKKAFKTVTQTSNHRNAIREDRIVDLAYKLDPELPMELAVLYDDDPAREEYRKRAQKQLDVHQLKKELGDSRSDVNLRTLSNDTSLATVAWRALGSLNSGRMIATDMIRLRDMLVGSSHYPLATSYPMYSWVLTNAMLKYSGTSEAAKYIRDLFEGVLQGAEFLFLMSEARGRLGCNPQWQDLGDNGKQVIVLSGERDKALRFIRDWLQQNAEDSVTIVDPYFGPEDLELVLQIVETDPYLKVRIVTGKAHQHKTSGNLSSVYSSAWRRICDNSPPDTEVLVVGSVKTEKTPFHDRWILSKSMGLRLGTSFNSLGNRDSEISILGNEEVKQIHRTINRYHTRELREFNGERVTYESFELLP